MRAAASAVAVLALTLPSAVSGQLPAGWALRFDPVAARGGQPAPPEPKPTDVMFMSMGSGFHIMSGPAAIYYKEEDPATGSYTLSARFQQTKTAGQEAYGLVFGGSDLQTPGQTYLYFLIRPADGGILVNHRTSDAPPRSIVAWTPNPAVNKQSASGSATNELAVRVDADAVHFLVNGREVRSLTRAELGGPSTDGLVGLRINHNIEVMVDGFRVSN
jgi:hypothetical protein